MGQPAISKELEFTLKQMRKFDSNNDIQLFKDYNIFDRMKYQYVCEYPNLNIDEYYVIVRFQSEKFKYIVNDNKIHCKVLLNEHNISKWLAQQFEIRKVFSLVKNKHIEFIESLNEAFWKKYNYSLHINILYSASESCIYTFIPY